jgi:hypothetical protein
VQRRITRVRISKEKLGALLATAFLLAFVPDVDAWIPEYECAMVEGVGVLPPTPFASVPFVVKLSADCIIPVSGGPAQVSGQVIEIPVFQIENTDPRCSIVGPRFTMETMVPVRGLPPGTYTVKLTFPKLGAVPCEPLLVTVADGQPVPFFNRYGLTFLIVSIAMIGMWFSPKSV